jgi:hypothetical protein
MLEEVFFQSNKTSMTLESILRQCDSFDEFEEKCSDDMLNSDCRTSIYLMRLLEKYHWKTSAASEAAEMSTGYLGLIIGGKRNATRDMLIRVAIAIGATTEETDYLLKYSGYNPLYVRNKRDVIIWYGLSKKEALSVINTNIKNRGLEPLYYDE